MGTEQRTRAHGSIAPRDGKLVSVIIPTHNRARFIGRALESVLGQSEVRSEIIVVDDGSTDATEDVLRSYGDRVRYVRQANAGPAVARNRALEMATGDYVAFQDSDDYFLPGALAALRDALDTRPELGGIQGGLVLVDEHEETVRVEEPWHDAPVFDVATCLRLKPILITALMLRREWVERVNGFDTAFRWGEDVDLLIRLVASGCRIEWLRRSISCYRRHPGNMTLDAIGAGEDVIGVLDKYYARADVPAEVRRDERSVRFYSLAWHAWEMSCTGQEEHISAWLTRSLEFSPFPAEETLFTWLRFFAENDAAIDRPPSAVSLWLPEIRKAARDVDSKWAQSENLLAWWIDVWCRYWDAEPELAIAGWERYRHLPTTDLLALVQDSLILSPMDRWIEFVEYFEADVQAHGIVPRDRRGGITGVYLTVFGHAAASRRYDVARAAFRRALGASRGPGALAAWLRFGRNSLAYATGFSKERKNPDSPARTAAGGGA